MKFTVLADPEFSATDKAIGLACQCNRDDCAWWNERFGMCSQAVDAYLKGQRDWFLERKNIRKGE